MQNEGKIVVTYELNGQKKKEVWDGTTADKKYILRTLTYMGAKNISFAEKKD